MRLLIPVICVLSSFTAILMAEDSYTVDPVHSAALFSINHLGVSNTHGRFNGIAGTLTWDGAAAEKSVITIAIKTESVDTAEAKRDQHLRSADYLNAKQFPEMTFASTSFTKVDDATYTVAGNVTLCGVTKATTVTVKKIGEGKDPWGGMRIGFETTFVLKRTDFGMKATPGIGDDVTITFALEGIKK